MSTHENDSSNCCTLLDEELLAIKRRCDQTTPKPWKTYIEGRDHLSGDSFIMTGGEDIYLTGATIADHDFIAHARQDIPNLIAEIERLRKILMVDNRLEL